MNIPIADRVRYVDEVSSTLLPEIKRWERIRLRLSRHFSVMSSIAAESGFNAVAESFPNAVRAITIGENRMQRVLTRLDSIYSRISMSAARHQQIGKLFASLLRRVRAHLSEIDNIRNGRL